MTGNFSTIYMSRNRVRSWDEQSFTIQVPVEDIVQSTLKVSPKMAKLEQNKQIFEKGKEELYRRLSVREVPESNLP